MNIRLVILFFVKSYYKYIRLINTHTGGAWKLIAVCLKVLFTLTNAEVDGAQFN